MPNRADRWQRELEYLARMARDDYRPSIREIAAAVDAANDTVLTDFAALVDLGLVADRDLPGGRQQRGRRPARAYAITELGLMQAGGEAPAAQAVAAGQPKDQEPVSGFDVDPDTTSERPGGFTLPPGHILFVADGDSMVGVGIKHGDSVTIRLSEEAQNGQIVLAEVAGTVATAAMTLKRIYWEDDQVRLQPENPRYQPLYYPTDEIRVRGVAVEAFRRYRLR